MRTLRGIGASRGVAIGPAFRFREVDLNFDRRTVENPEHEWERLEDALEEARRQLIALQGKAGRSAGDQEAALFGAHAEMLEDPELLNVVRESVSEDRLNAEAAFSDAIESYARALESLESEYMRARAADVRDVGQRVLRILLDHRQSPTEDLKHPSIILARDLTPSDTMLLDRSLVLGFCTAEGGATSHTAILARGLGLPAIVGAGRDVLTISDGETLVLDGTAGTVLVAPDDETIAEYEQRRERTAGALKSAREKAREPAVTRDGRQVEVVANIGNVKEARDAIEAGAEGVGLLRTEFLYLERDRLPSEEEQYEAYRAVTDVFGNLPVVLRTLDIGGDKQLPYLDLSHEMNPFLGVRAIRLCLARPSLFRPQLRAALRAGAGRNLKIMFPMVAEVSEIREARGMLEECRAELMEEGRTVADGVQVGIMVEVPAAALMARHLAAEVDFFSIGTNDLTQYTMAADRTNAGVASLVSGFQPAVLRLVRDTIAAAHDQGKWVGLCGELGGEPLAIPILLGLDLDEFSMAPSAIPLAKQIIRQLSLDETKRVAQEALGLDSAQAVRELIRDRVPAADAR